MPPTSDSTIRSSGILLHPTSLPGPYGIGDLGPAAYRWIDWLAAAKQTWWQILPLGPTGYGDSPYQCFSAFAGNPVLISPEALAVDGLLSSNDVRSTELPAGRVDYGRVISVKNEVLYAAWRNFQTGKISALLDPFQSFIKLEAEWLDDYALFMALRRENKNAEWQRWPAEIRQRDPGALEAARSRLKTETREEQFRQFLFFRQWSELRLYAAAAGIRLIGDAPIFVASDSVDVWANPELFSLDDAGLPTVVAGVPPDYFSKTGQLWGNPLYDWPAHKATGYGWWIARLRATLRMVDQVRLDHFRGFEAYWEIPAANPTAEIGQWVRGPGSDFFNAVRQSLGELPLIAENLGVITPEVESIRKSFGFPGMCILQFAFSGPDNPFLPHHHERELVAYTGTHDNDTTLGWYATASEAEKEYMHRYLGWVTYPDWNLIRLAWASVANLAIAPLQDLLNLPTEARMNFPGQAVGNWGWRFTPDMLTDAVRQRLADLTYVYDRIPPHSPQA